MEKLTVGQVQRRLNKKNPWASHLARVAEHDSFKRETAIYPKRDLITLSQQILAKKLFPVVDKKLGLVFAVAEGWHTTLISTLQEYHEIDETGDSSGTTNEYFMRYLDEGRGYYVSAMKPDTILVGTKYNADEVDQDFFDTKRLKHEY